MARTVTVHEAKTHLSRLLRAVEAGEEIIIARGRTPVARLSPAPPAADMRHQPGEWKGLFGVSEDALDALAEPMSEAEIAEFERIDSTLAP
ncbi:MAG: type II toxin-antitoxin system prevent-host-death family antitoxin [Oceanicaulis sp.]|nr:type II toxin-antitoxin system prevent-host-death family antitoxin [Oceanicaulis sp.]